MRVFNLFFMLCLLCECRANTDGIGTDISPRSQHEGRTHYSPTQLMLHNVREVGFGPHVDHVGSYHAVAAAIEHPDATVDDVAWSAYLMYQLYTEWGIHSAGVCAQQLAQEFLMTTTQDTEAHVVIERVHMRKVLNDLGSHTPNTLATESSTHPDRRWFSPAQLMLHNARSMGLGPHVDHVGTYYMILAALDHSTASISDVAWAAQLMACLDYNREIPSAKADIVRLAYDVVNFSESYPDGFMDKIRMLNLLKEFGETDLFKHYLTLSQSNELTPDQLIHLRAGLYNIHDPQAEELRRTLDQRYMELPREKSPNPTPPVSGDSPEQISEAQHKQTNHRHHQKTRKKCKKSASSSTAKKRNCTL